MTGHFQKAECNHRVQTREAEIDSCIIITRALACCLTKDPKESPHACCLTKELKKFTPHILTTLPCQMDPLKLLCMYDVSSFDSFPPTFLSSSLTAWA